MITIRREIHVSFDEKKTIKTMNEIVKESNFPWKVKKDETGYTYIAEHSLDCMEFSER